MSTAHQSRYCTQETFVESFKLEQTAAFAFLSQVFEFIGQGSKKAKSMPSSAAGFEAMECMPEDRHVKGMSGEEQEARLHAFKVSFRVMFSSLRECS